VVRKVLPSCTAADAVVLEDETFLFERYAVQCVNVMLAVFDCLIVSDVISVNDETVIL
jgi:hypothetical protein